MASNFRIVVCVALCLGPLAQADIPLADFLSGHYKKENPPPPLKPPVMPQPPTAPPPVVKPPPPAPAPSKPPAPAPFQNPKYYPSTPIHYSTAVRAPLNPRVMKPKSGNPAQTYLGNFDDARDLEITIQNTKAQHTAAVAAAKSYAELLERQNTVFHAGALAADELAQSQYDLDFARALERQLEAQVRSLAARQEQKQYQAKVAAELAKFDLELFYGLYTKEWRAQCEVADATVDMSVAQLTLNRTLYDSIIQVQNHGVVSAFEVELRLRDRIAAEADLEAKKTFAKACREGWPSLADLQKMMEGAGNRAVAFAK